MLYDETDYRLDYMRVKRFLLEHFKGEKTIEPMSSL